MAGPNRSERSEVSQEAAVIGVVIAGVLVSFTFPGPFDWGSTLIGLLLLGVLVAYGSAPVEPARWRRALGGAVGLAFCIVLIIGRPLDQIVIGQEGAKRYLLSGWTDTKSRPLEDGGLPATGTGLDRPTREEADRPWRGHGALLLGLWGTLVIVLMAVWRFRVGRQRQSDAQ